MRIPDKIITYFFVATSCILFIVGILFVVQNFMQGAMGIKALAFRVGELEAHVNMLEGR